MRIPNFYFFPFVNSGFFTTQALSRIVFIILFILIFFLFKESYFSVTKDKIICNILVLLFLLTSSLSLIWAPNAEAFFVRYKDIVIGILCFFVFQYYANERKKILLVLLAPIPFNIFYQFLLLYGGNIISLLQGLVYQKHFDLVSYNLYRGRIYTEGYDEAFVPLLILFLQSKKRTIVFWVIVQLLFLSSFAFLSNFRTRVLMLILGLIGSFIILQKVTIKRLVSIFLGVGMSALLIEFVSFFKWGHTFYDRFILTNTLDVVTVFSRLNQIKDALVMGLFSPFGVGLGNYYDMIITRRGVYYAFLTTDYQSTAYQNIHNNFASVIAETGYISFMIYTLLLLKFLVIDKKILKGKDQYKKALVISFWILFFFGLFNPPIPGSYQILFWGIRGLLI